VEKNFFLNVQKCLSTEGPNILLVPIPNGDIGTNKARMFMLKRMLLAKTKKQLDAKGLGHLPGALQTMLSNPKELGPVFAYVILAQVGIFDSLGFYFFFSRVISKLFPKKGVSNGKSEQKKETSSMPMR
jgi:hypothetical protein